MVFMAIVVAIGAAFFFFHPSSPYHSRYSFVVSYDVVGTLTPGNRVEIRGIGMGQITKVDLTDDAIYVTVEVLSEAKIARNSEFRLINSGLMGEREMCILTGDGKDFIADGDTVVGHFDDGTSGLSKSLAQIFTDLDDVLGTIVALKDSVTIGSTGKQITRILNKGEKLLGSSGDVINNRKAQAEETLGKLDGILENAKSVLEKVSEKGGKTVEGVEKLMTRTEDLMEKVKASKSALDAEMAKLDQDNNTVGAVLAPNGRFVKELDRLSKNIDALIKDIKKNGANINVDIF